MVTREAAGLRVKVLDFGLALGGGVTRWEGSGIAGTPAYLAPEVIDGEPPSQHSDLYAVGVVFYELLVGRHPFGGSAVPLAALLDEVMRGQADLAPLNDQPLLQAAVAQLLAKDPTQRFVSSDAALAALSSMIGIPDRVEPEAVRESFLQAATFVGREQELAQLTAALQGAGRGAGTAWLIGGESGVGKSRLLDELRTLAMVQGMLVARGQAVTEGGAYRVFQDVLRLLCLQVALSDLEAAVLATLLPDLGPLLGRELLPAPPLDAQAAQIRLLNIVESVLQRQVQPVLLLLEDLHWADKESLALLRRIQRWVGQQALLLVGSYQDDEAPELPTVLPGMQLLKLGRLDALSIKELCASMLGPAGERPEMVELIVRETEGNVFFIVELARALFEDAGRSGQGGEFGAGGLPVRLLAGGVGAVIQRRLARVPAAARPLLQLAAVLGRQLDVAVLHVGEPHLDEWLASCAAAAVIEIYEQQWRFSHDKLREALLDELTPAKAKRLHSRGAEYLLRAYADPTQHAAALAHHYAAAGETPAAVHFAELAGEQALAKGTLEEAVHWQRQTLDLYQHTTATVAQQLRAQRRLVSAQFGLGRFHDVVTGFERALPLLGLHGLGRRVPAWLGVIGEALIQLAHRVLGALLRRIHAPQRRERTAELLAMSADASEAYMWQGQALSSLHVALQALNRAETLGEPSGRVIWYSALGYILAVIPLGAASRFYRGLATGLLPTMAEDKTAMYFLRIDGTLKLIAGQQGAAVAVFEHSLLLGSALGDDNSQMNILTDYAVSMFLQGEYQQTERRCSELFALAQRCQNPQFIACALTFLGALALLRGQLGKATALFNEAQGQAQAQPATLTALLISGHQALAALRRGEPAVAQQKADETLQHIRSIPLPNFVLGSYAHITEVYLELWEHSAMLDVPARRRLLAALRQALAKLHQHVGATVIAQPSAELWQGRFELRRGRPVVAQRRMQAALQRAQELSQPLDEALAHYWLARVSLDCGFALGTMASAGEHLRAARRLFERLGAAWYVEQVEAALRGLK